MKPAWVNIYTVRKYLQGMHPMLQWCEGGCAPVEARCLPVSSCSPLDLGNDRPLKTIANGLVARILNKTVQ